MPFPYIFTFHSFKGGVGRSLALLNTAYTLAGRGRHVLVVDMDLEAPGISGFLSRQQELASPAAARPLDVLSLLWEAIAAVRAGGKLADAARNLPPVSSYVRAVREDKLEDLRPKLGLLGRLDVLGTDLERNYWDRLAELGLRNLPQEKLIALSGLLHHYFKAQRFPHRPLGLEDFEAPLPTAYDYVLVDSRTGYTEIGGLCVGPLADRLVVLTGLNDQNVRGTLDLLQEVGIRPQARPADDEPWDDADAISANPTEALSLGPKPTIVVASPVPTGEIAYKRQRLKELEELLGIRPVPLSYHPQMGLIESVFVRDYPEEYLALEYDSLATRIMAQVGDDPPSLARKSQGAWNEKEELAGGIYPLLRLASQEPAMGFALLAQLGNLGKPSDDNGRWAMRQLCAFLSHHQPARLVALGNWGVALLEQARTKAGEDADRLFEEAGRKFAEALRLKPNDHEALSNWGNALSGQAKAKAGAEADRLFEEAGHRYAEAVRLKTNYHEALYNWGLALSIQAKTKAGKDADRLFEEAGRKYAEALRLKPDDHKALNNWGTALSDQAKTKAGVEADRLFEQAGRKFAEALKLKPDSHETLFNLGTALLEQARTKAGGEADHLFEEAGRKFADALRLKPDYYEALSNWGSALLEQAKTKAGEEAGRRLRQAAREKLLEAERIQIGAGAYNLACVEAVEGNMIEAVRWLGVSVSSGGRLTRSKLAAERDFDGIRNQPEFVSFVESLPEK
jgi:cytochrome c-type biogenesis protein CcmH/NrfG/MinD-like ATPase involved in chromosome partitioning or flagellar assembly